LKLGAVLEFERAGAENAVGGEVQVRPDVGEDGGGVVGELVDLGEKDVGVGFAAMGGGVEGAAFGVGEMTQGILHQAQAVFADGGRRIGGEALVDEKLGVHEVRPLVKDHGQTEERRGEGALGEVDGFLEIFCGGVELAEAEIGEGEVVVGAVGSRSQFDGFEEVFDAGGGVASGEQLGAFRESFDGFAGEGEVLDRYYRIVANRLRARVRRERQNHDCKEESGWFHAGATWTSLVSVWLGIGIGKRC
jgi:hypothetical protein